MKIKFETNMSKIRNKDVFEKALHIIEEESLQGFFRAKGETEFKFFREDSLVKDAKFVELHIVKVYGKGEYKFNGNLSYNTATKEVKFYVLSVVEFDTFQYDDVKMAEFKNVANESNEADLEELKAVLKKIEDNRPPYKPNRKPSGGFRNGRSNGNGSRSNGNGRSNNGSRDGQRSNNNRRSRDGERSNDRRSNFGSRDEGRSNDRRSNDRRSNEGRSNDRRSNNNSGRSNSRYDRSSNRGNR